MNSMRSFPEDRMVLIILDNGHKYPAVSCPTNGYLITLNERTFWGNDLVIKQVPSQIGTPVGWKELT